MSLLDGQSRTRNVRVCPTRTTSCLGPFPLADDAQRDPNNPGDLLEADDLHAWPRVFTGYDITGPMEDHAIDSGVFVAARHGRFTHMVDDSTVVVFDHERVGSRHRQIAPDRRGPRYSATI
jgi:hypothetical protein